MTGPGDWAVDYYGPAGTVVKLQAGGVGAMFTAKVQAVMPSCYDADGGSTVFVDLYVGNYLEGWAAFAHLDQVSVSAGNWISWSTPLGKLKQWNYSTCYQVGGPSGVHTHMELYSYSNYACYKNYTPPGVTLAEAVDLGQAGRTIYTTDQPPSVCQ